MTEARTEALTALNTNGQSIIDGEIEYYQINVFLHGTLFHAFHASMCVVIMFGLTGEIPSRLSTELADCLWSFIEACRNVSVLA